MSADSGIVFVVTQGDYSDYGILGIFTSRELAKGFIELCEANLYSPKIEEWKLDDIPPHTPGHLPFRVRFDRDGITHVGRACITDCDSDVRPYGDSKQMCCCVWAEGEQYAADIGNERRMQVILRGEWETDHSAWRQQQKDNNANL